MERLLKPKILDIDPNSTTSAKEFKHWLKTFENFIAECGETAPDKLRTLQNFVSHTVYEFIDETTTYASAVAALKKVYEKTPNEIFARHRLATRKQLASESLDDYVRELQILAKDCNFTVRTAVETKEDMVRDSFISGLSSHTIRQRLLELTTTDLDSVLVRARTLKLAQRNASSYDPRTTVAAIVPSESKVQHHLEPDAEVAAVFQKKPLPTTYSSNRENCFFCGYKYHARSLCPAKNSQCRKCTKTGHYARMCKSNITSTVASVNVTGINDFHYPVSLKPAKIGVTITGNEYPALVDTGSTDSFISMELAKKLKLKFYKNGRSITFASKSHNEKCKYYALLDFKIGEAAYSNHRFLILDNLCSSILLGQDFQKNHETVKFIFNGMLPELVVDENSTCALTAAKMSEPSIFPNVDGKCRPIAVKSRRYCTDDQVFIKEKVADLFKGGIIQHSISPWRAQVVVVKDQNDKTKKRLCIDYSQTVNIYTELDAYPLPRIDDMINELAKYEVFSTFDLKSAYHQIPIRVEDRKYTAFEANGRLYEFKRIPFGVTNGVAAFQRAMDKMVEEEKLVDTFPYLDNITVGGKTQCEHDQNVRKLHEALSSRNLVLNESKSVRSVKAINVLGYNVGHHTIKPDPERLIPLLELPPPENVGALRRATGMFAYYSKWIKNFSDHIQPLIKNTSFPLAGEALSSFEKLKIQLSHASLASIDEAQPFVVECDASDNTVSAVLNQGGRPVAFMSRTLHGSEINYPAVEKEATAIIEAVRKWRHLLARGHFDLITDQRSVSFMFDRRRRSKIKNCKIQEWRLELACFSYTIKYRPGKENVPADALTRAYSCAVNSCALKEIHDGMCHPGVTRLLHFVRSKNLPYSTEDVKALCKSCSICARLKPRFFKPPSGSLIKATHPMERLSIDFKGPITQCQYPYLLTVVDEYSRFPFAFACPDMKTTTVIKCLENIFTFAGMPQYLHSDRGSSFMSSELKMYLTQKGIATSKTTPYHSTGNAQCERFNQTIWNSIALHLESNKISLKSWNLAIPNALHAIRSLLSTAINTTPHERFFSFQRRSMNGSSLPDWLMSPGKVYLRKFVRDKTEDLVDEVDLIDSNLHYATVKYSDGKESTVSTKDLAPWIPDPLTKSTNNCSEPPEQYRARTPARSAEMLEPGPEQTPQRGPTLEESSPSDGGTEEIEETTDAPVLRRSTRASKPPQRLTYDRL